MIGLLFTKDHEYLRLDGDTAVVGITDYAQEQLGDIVFVDLPKVGKKVTKGGELAVIESVKQGGTIAEPLRHSPVFPGMVTQMVAVGEETGALDAMLAKIADFYEDQVDASVKSLTSILEPVMIVVIGGMVGFIVISMYLPLFKVYDQIN